MLFFCAVGMTMIIYSPYILSNALIGLICLSLFDIELKPFRLRLHPQLKENWSGFWRATPFWVTSLIFFMVLLSCLYSTDLQYALERLRLKIPFLVLPFAFYSLPRLTRRSYQGLFYFLLVILFLSNIGIGINYLLHFEEINEKMILGQPLPTPRNHVRYSLLLGISILAGFILAYRRFHFRYTWERWLVIAMTLFNFVFIHILSVRSGLLIMYISMLIGALLLIVLQKKILLGLVSIAMIVLLPTIAFHTIPSFKAKLSYAHWEYQEYKHGRRTISGSDQGRVRSFEAGWEVLKRNPLLGVGAGDLKQAVYAEYDVLYPDIDKKLMPHNQYLSIAAGMGGIGLLLFLLAIFYPFFYGYHFKEPFFFIFMLSMLLSFLVENTIENSIGIGFYVLFLGINLSYLMGRK